VQTDAVGKVLFHSKLLAGKNYGHRDVVCSLLYEMRNKTKSEAEKYFIASRINSSILDIISGMVR
jgi:hypothetical protein